MKKMNILKKSMDFDRIIKNNRSYKYKDYILYVEKVEDPTYHFGLSVGKKVGNAVTRNKIKRQLKTIIDKNSYEKGINCIIIVRKGLLEKSFSERENDLIEAFKKLNIIKEKCNEKK